MHHCGRATGTNELPLAADTTHDTVMWSRFQHALTQDGVTCKNSCNHLRVFAITSMEASIPNATQNTSHKRPLSQIVRARWSTHHIGTNGPRADQTNHRTGHLSHVKSRHPMHGRWTEIRGRDIVQSSRNERRSVIKLRHMSLTARTRRLSIHLLPSSHAENGSGRRRSKHDD